ncbi:hypothetical protein KVR01_003629 [Diaporthe batatas]|uniref:uncharacterized protein n=1 Tax=Diaporthe batatas TaxID=748121 RepID=UPI001D05BC63|nr:uncharacterized protein KVR01_003629 [Diaporthe batatas]KAG8167940.1 hypothetical protein KVR01_003629 [Diaporthe batatas]
MQNPPNEVGAYDRVGPRLLTPGSAKLPFVPPPSLHGARPWASRPLSQDSDHCPSQPQSLTMDDDTTQPYATKPRIPYACEACRAAKVKCTSGDTTGICRRCSVSKRECVFKTGPRKRRRRDKLRPIASRTTPPPSAPSKTFTIDVPLLGDNDTDLEPSEGFDALRDAHDAFLEDLVPDPDDLDGDNDALTGQGSSSVSGTAPFSASTPSVSSRSVHGVSSIQPRFNLESATSLLESFRNGMLPYFPVIRLPIDATVQSLSKDKPFVLLAILAAASGGRNMQGHSLYDEEFRKVLGLKFVSGGERSLELLAGLQIYCAWYPFHLRPKQKQATQYIRMAADIVHDLELDRAPDNFDRADFVAEEKSMDGIRAYISCYYLVASMASIWTRKNSLPFEQWTSTCCDILEMSGGGQADQCLAWLARLGNIIEQTASLTRKRGQVSHEPQHVLLMVKGMEAQLQEWRGRMSPDVSSKPVVYIATLFTEILLHGYTLLRFPDHNAQKQAQLSQDTLIEPSRLWGCAQSLRVWYDYVSSLPASEFASFSAMDWGHFVGLIILGLKLSFPLPNECPAWDHTAAREVVGLGLFLEKFTEDGSDDANLTPASSKSCSGTDVLSASKVVLGVVKRKYDKRLAALEKAALAYPPHPVPPDTDSGIRKCPMFDGSLDPFIQTWDDTFLDPSSIVYTSLMGSGLAGAPGQGSHSAQPVVFHDLWATMTMGWSQENSEDMEFDGH